MTRFYDRKYSLAILTYRGQAITFSDNIRFTFRVEKRIDRVYQFAEITIYNLSADTETDILQNGQQIVLEAGYKNGNFGLIFQGFIRQPIRGKEDGTTYYLKLICIDGDDALNLGVCDFVLSNGQTAQQIAERVARSASIPFDIKINGELPQQATARAKIFFGQPKDFLRSLALNNNAFFYFDNGVANISALDQPPPPVVPNLNYQSGMIGFPAQTDQGVQVKTLINTNLLINNWFHLNNKNVILNQLEFGTPQTLLDLDGVYRIIGITATGDTRGNDWYYDIEAISQAGALPAMFADPNSSGV